MKQIKWNSNKNQQLMEWRGLSFEDTVFYLQRGKLLGDIEHPNKEKYPNQQVFVLNIDEYVYLVPDVEDQNEIFLKTVIPSNKATSWRNQVKKEKFLTTLKLVSLNQY